MRTAEAVIDHRWKFPSSLCVKPDRPATLVPVRLCLIIRQRQAGPVVDYSHHRSTSNLHMRCLFLHSNVHLHTRRNVAILSDMRHPCILSRIVHMACARHGLALEVPAMIEPTGRLQSHPLPGLTAQSMSPPDLCDPGHDRSHHLAINQIR
jgi:hypothetical protein